MLRLFIGGHYDGERHDSHDDEETVVLVDAPHVGTINDVISQSVCFKPLRYNRCRLQCGKSEYVVYLHDSISTMDIFDAMINGYAEHARVSKHKVTRRTG